MNISSLIANNIAVILNTMKASGDLPEDLDVAGIEVQESREPTHGDFASNAAMVLARRAKLKPHDLANMIVAKLSTDEIVSHAAIAGPGFINITISDAVWHDLVATILKEKKNYGSAKIGSGKRLHVEYVSANPTGPMHVGHCRGAVFGDTLCNLLSFVGYDVCREYYVNDAGAQVEKLGETALLRYFEALGDNIGQIPEGLYPGDYMKPIGKELVKLYGDQLRYMDKAETHKTVRQFAIESLLNEIRLDLASLNVEHDVFFSEQSLTANDLDQVAKVIQILCKANLIYKGELPKPLGYDDEGWVGREQTLFKSTAFGDDVDRALLKSDGGYTYFAHDAAYHLNKLERKFDGYINVLGADHIGYISRINSVVNALSESKVKLDTLVIQLVRVMRNGEPLRMSKRAGTFVTLRDVVDEVGCDPVRFTMMMRKHDTSLDFDLEKVVTQTKDNPVFYVQYAHARAASIFRKVSDVFPKLKEDSDDLHEADLSLLDDPSERLLIRVLAKFPRVVESAARDLEPHRIAFYLYELASTFHQQHALGNECPKLRFIQVNDFNLTSARLALVASTQHIIACGLKILGVSAPVEMK
ncbi:MAG: Arginine--tRNA ligase [Hyphomicrobiaceae bacterium hypho_1]